MNFHSEGVLHGWPMCGSGILTSSKESDLQILLGDKHRRLTMRNEYQEFPRLFNLTKI